MSADSDFRCASERLELAVNAVAIVARGCPLDSAFAILHALQVDEERYGSVIYRELDKLAAISDDPPIKWKYGRGRSGFVRVPSHAFPHVWSSAHEAARTIQRLALEYFFWPLEGITDAKEQQSTFKKLLSKSRRKAVAMTMEEVADWEERIRRERAKLLVLGHTAVPEATEPMQEDEEPLTPNEYAVLQQLAKNKPQLIKITDLAADLNCGRTAASEAVDSLKQRGLVISRGERSGVAITKRGIAALRPCDRPLTASSNAALDGVKRC